MFRSFFKNLVTFATKDYIAVFSLLMLVFIVGCLLTLLLVHVLPINFEDSKSWGNIVTIFFLSINLVGFAGFLIQYRLRTRYLEEHHREEMDFQKQLHDEALEAQKKSMELFSYGPLDNFAGDATRAIKMGLAKDPKWAAEALERAKIFPYENSKYYERTLRYKDEKEYLAKFAAYNIFHRVLSLAKNKKMQHIYLLVDSGSTLTPFFYYFGQLSFEYREKSSRNNYSEEVLNKIRIITNSFSGIEKFISTAGIGSNRYDLSIPCFLLPGYPQPVYSATTGRHTNRALRHIITRHERYGAESDIYTIAVTTGNYILFEDESSREIPTLLSRGRGHTSFKMNMLNIANEAFVISPLCKLISPPEKITLDEFNGLLNLHNHRRNIVWNKNWRIFMDDSPSHLYFGPAEFPYPEISPDPSAFELVLTRVQTELTKKILTSKQYRDLPEGKSERDHKSKFEKVPTELLYVEDKRANLWNPYEKPNSRDRSLKFTLITTNRRNHSQFSSHATTIRERFGSKLFVEEAEMLECSFFNGESDDVRQERVEVFKKFNDKIGKENSIIMLDFNHNTEEEAEIKVEIPVRYADPNTRKLFGLRQ